MDVDRVLLLNLGNDEGEDCFHLLRGRNADVADWHADVLDGDSATRGDLAALRAGTERGTRRSPETDEQRHFVRNWAHTCSKHDPAPIEASAWNPNAIDHYPIFVRSKANHERWDLAVQIAQATIGEPGLIDGEVLGIARVVYSNQIQSGE